MRTMADLGYRPFEKYDWYKNQEGDGEWCNPVGPVSIEIRWHTVYGKFIATIRPYDGGSDGNPHTYRLKATSMDEAKREAWLIFTKEFCRAIL